MKKILFLLITLIHLVANSQIPSYYSILRNNLKLADSTYTIENFQKLANCCERILMVESNEWLPYYYSAYAFIHMCFIEKNDQEKDNYADRAQVLLDSAFMINPIESELFVLQAMLYYGLMEVSPMLRGPKYLPKAKHALADAEKYNPQNPRIYFLRGKSTMYTPEFFGGGKDAALPILENAVQQYSEFIPESNLHPAWGYEGAYELYMECKN